MILGRRDPPGPLRRLRGWLWPRTGLRRAGRYLLARAGRMPGTPHAVAAGFAAGAAVSVTPFLGGHTLLTVALAWLTRGNVLAALLGGVVVGNPWTVPLFLAATYRLGCLVLGLPPEGLHHLARLGSRQAALAGRAQQRLAAREQAPGATLRPPRLHRAIATPGRLPLPGCGTPRQGILKTASYDKMPSPSRISRSSTAPLPASLPRCPSSHLSRSAKKGTRFRASEARGDAGFLIAARCANKGLLNAARAQASMSFAPAMNRTKDSA